MARRRLRKCGLCPSVFRGVDTRRAFRRHERLFHTPQTRRVSELYPLVIRASHTVTRLDVGESSMPSSSTPIELSGELVPDGIDPLVDDDVTLPPEGVPLHWVESLLSEEANEWMNEEESGSSVDAEPELQDVLTGVLDVEAELA